MTNLLAEQRLDVITAARMVRPPKLTVSQWADQYRYLSREASAEPGKWRTSRAPYLQGIMEALSDPGIEEVVVMSAAQVGKTEVILNAIGFYCDQDPAPTLAIQPTLEMAQAFSKDRIAPMVRDTPRLKDKFADVKSRTADNTILHKTFPGGHLTVVGANSPSGLAARPIRILLADEVDRYPVSAGTEGDPVTLAKKRTSTFWNRKLVMTSTPTLKGLSRIEKAYQDSDQRIYEVRCASCNTAQTLTWEQVRWEAGRPETAHMVCRECGVTWTEIDKPALLASGEWVAAFPGRTVAGFHLNALYSPWAKWAELVAEWMRAQGHPEMLKAFINTVLAETWEEDAERMDAEGLMARREEYGGPVPAFVGCLTAGCDVQADRVEILVRGWGAGEESALVHLETIRGDPSRGEVWRDVDRVLTGEWGGLRLAAACIDSGYLPEPVYRYVAPRQRKRVYATKGQSTPGLPILGHPSKRPNREGVRVWPIGTESAKDLLFLRLKIQAPGPGCYHFPAWADADYFNQLTAEQARTKYRHGRPYRVYEKEASARNEALDMEVLAYAALLTLGPSYIRSLGTLAARRGPAPPPPVEPPSPTYTQQAVAARRRPPTRQGWVRGY